MKQSEIKRAGNGFTGLLAGLALALLVPAAHANFFTGAFAPENWTMTNSVNAGTFEFVGSGASATMVIHSVAGNTNDSLTIITLLPTLSSGSERVDFNWQLTKNGNDGDPVAYCYVGEAEYPLLGSSGTIGFDIDYYTPVLFELSGRLESAGKSPAQLEIIPIPEPANMLGAMMAMATGCRWYLRRRNAGA